MSVNIPEKKVLVIDRRTADDFIPTLCRRVLENVHYRVEVAHDLATLPEVAGEFVPDVVLMPFISGFDIKGATEQLKTVNNDMRFIGYSQDTSQFYPNKGIDFALSVPFTKDGLHYAVEGMAYGPVVLCAGCHSEYQKGVRQTLLYKSRHKLGKFDIWFDDTTKPVDKLVISHGLCPGHYKEAHDSIDLVQ